MMGSMWQRLINLGGVIGLLLIGGFIGYVAFPIVASSRVSHMLVARHVRIREIELTLFTYMGDHQDRFPTLSEWQNVIQKKPDQPVRWRNLYVHYQLNPQVQGKRLEDLPSDTIAVFEYFSLDPKPTLGGVPPAVALAPFDYVDVIFASSQVKSLPVKEVLENLRGDKGETKTPQRGG